MSAGTDRAGFEPAGIEQRLKAEIDRYPVRVRPDLAREAYQAHRRHRVIRRSAGALGAAAVIALTVTVAATGAIPFSAAPARPAGPMSGVPPLPASGIPDPSLVPAPAGNGLSARQAARDILWARTTYVTGRASDSMVEQSFSYGVTAGVFDTKARYTFYSSDGRPYLDHSIATRPQAPGVSLIDTRVNYPHRDWAQNGGASSLAPGASQNACLAGDLANLTGYGLDLVNFAAHPDLARSLVSCPRLAVTRGTEADGIAAIKIADHRGIALWVNAATFLPVKMVTGGNNSRSYQTLPNGKRATVSTTQYGYLAPTQANLGYLRVPIPRAFRGSSTGMPAGQSVTTWTRPPGAIGLSALVARPGRATTEGRRAGGCHAAIRVARCLCACRHRGRLRDRHRGRAGRCRPSRRGARRRDARGGAHRLRPA